MQLKSLTLTRQQWGEFIGQVTGTVEFESPAAKIALVITPAMASKLLAVVGEALVQVSKEAAESLQCDVIESVDHARLESAAT